MPPKPPIRVSQTATSIKRSAYRPPPISPKSATAPRAIPKTSSRPIPRSSQTSPASSPPPSQDGRRSASSNVRYWGGIGVLCLGTLITIRDHIVSIDTVVGSSMAPTLSPLAHETGKQDWIVIGRGPAQKQTIKRGDVVTLWKPHKPDEISIKRVVALAGDVVYPHRGYALDPEVVYAKRLACGSDGLGQPDPDAIGGDEVELGKVTVPMGHMWVEGDNWRRSLDSCDFGPVSTALLDGKALWIWRDWWKMKAVGDERKKEKGHWTKVVPAVEWRKNDGLLEASRRP